MSISLKNIILGCVALTLCTGLTAQELSLREKLIASSRPYLLHGKVFGQGMIQGATGRGTFFCVKALTQKIDAGSEIANGATTLAGFGAAAFTMDGITVILDHVSPNKFSSTTLSKETAARSLPLAQLLGVVVGGYATDTFINSFLPKKDAAKITAEELAENFTKFFGEDKK